MRAVAWLVHTLVLTMAMSAGLVLSGEAVLARGPVSVSGLAEEASGAVVNISTTHVFSETGEAFPEAPEGSPLEEFFNELNPNTGEGEEAMREARSLGSGFVIDPSGLIATNYHVIEGADEILVSLADGAWFEAEVVGVDEKTDLAVLRIDAGYALPFVSFGDSDTAEIGDWVMAIGNPFGLGGSVTLGIVSARNRNINTGPYDNFIQTDAAINQGNSGGPLFDMNGKVVGINTAIISRTGGGLGIGFAVPSNLAQPVIKQLAEFGETRRGWLGVGIQQVSADIAASLGRANTNGAMVVDVTPQGPSEGVLSAGDIILAFDGRPVIEMRDLPRMVAETAVGREIEVLVLRNGAEARFAITLGRLEEGEILIASQNAEVLEEQAAQVDPSAVEEASLSALVGLDVRTLTELDRTELNLEPDVEGVLIAAVEAGSDAEEKGLFPGLVIAEVNQQAIASVEELASLVSSAREAGRPAVLFKLLDGSDIPQFVAVRLQ